MRQVDPHSIPNICTGYRPGIFGAIISMNADHYIRQRGFDPELESTMAADLAHFWKRFSPEFDQIIYLEDSGPVVGALLLEGVERNGDMSKADQSIKINWFIIGNGIRGQGYGRAVLEKAIDVSKDLGFGKIQLTTDHDAKSAIHLYETSGFMRNGDIDGDVFGKPTKRYFYQAEL